MGTGTIPSPFSMEVSMNAIVSVVALVLAFAAVALIVSLFGDD